MRILVCGAHGFVGRHISHRLQQAGHEIVYGVHQFSDGGTAQHNELLIDYHKDTSTSIWEKRFAALAASGKIDIVINAVGILTASNTASFAAIHRDTPIALFQAASDAGVRGILQISALGPDDSTLSQTASASQELSSYLQTKRDTDQYLSQLNCTNLILRPSLIVGMDGGSSQLFRSLASMPVIALPGKGEQALQPVHIDDLCRCVEKWVEEVA
jgi:nucleoside-diphosphate-sugar epimerase